MKIKKVNFYYYNASFHSPIVTPKVEMTHRKALIIELVTDENQLYFGECNSFETNWYDKETIYSVKSILEDWARNIKGVIFNSFTDWEPYLNQLESYPAARCTAVMAIYQMYHQLPSFTVEYGATASGLTKSQLQTLQTTQPPRIKLKWSNHLNEDIRKLDTHLKHNYYLALDANESLTISDLEKVEQVTSQNIIYIEEPFKSLSLLNEVDLNNYPPIAIDEKALNEEAIISIIERYPIEVVIIKPFRVGGFDKAQQLIQTLHQHQVKVVVGGMYEYGLSRYFTALLANEGDYPGDITPNGYYFDKDFTQGTGKLKEGLIHFNPPIVNKTQLIPYE
ncbi:o-succinylbenzoate synthase [Staphylococcus sp. Marseille-Q1834]|uniref:o-succinylbenzoate synthase n=1 Tax=Staphylococcus sp. Marseille-Q1834 TaxID=2866594 RepID=UPI001CF8A73E|nr:o-succinylbenzoate synthase [Staphylococcus sp. Marseille-Q1834]